MPPLRALSTTQIRFIGCLLCLGWMLPGCGNVLYAVSANRASSKLEEARQAGAEKTTLYEYTLARQHLDKAMSEASEADYGDAYELAQLANEYATQALAKARLRMRPPNGNDTPAPTTAVEEQK